MSLPINGPGIPFAFTLSDEVVALELDTTVYRLNAVFRACYKLTDRAYFFLARDETDSGLLVLSLWAKAPGADLRALASELCNELIDQEIREALSQETRSIRELIVAQAFSEGNLLDPQRDEGNYDADPLGIGAAR